MISPALTKRDNHLTTMQSESGSELFTSAGMAPAHKHAARVGARLATNIKRVFLPGESDAGAAKAAAADATPVTDPEELQALINRYTSEIELNDGTPVRLRPLLPQDKANLQAGMKRMSDHARYRRFMSQMKQLPPGLLQRLTEIDYDNHFALGALTLEQHPPQGIGVARYIRDEDNPHVAEPAVTIIDSHQGRGLGHQLLDQLMAIALEHGVTHFRATLLADNEPMKQLFLQQGAELKHAGYGEFIADFALPWSEQTRSELVYKLARHAYAGAVNSARHALPYPLNL